MKRPSFLVSSIRNFLLFFPFLVRSCFCCWIFLQLEASEQICAPNCNVVVNCPVVLRHGAHELSIFPHVFLWMRFQDAHKFCFEIISLATASLIVSLASLAQLEPLVFPIFSLHF